MHVAHAATRASRLSQPHAYSVSGACRPRTWPAPGRGTAPAASTGRGRRLAPRHVRLRSNDHDSPLKPHLRSTLTFCCCSAVLAYQSHVAWAAARRVRPARASGRDASRRAERRRAKTAAMGIGPGSCRRMFQAHGSAVDVADAVMNLSHIRARPSPRQLRAAHAPRLCRRPTWRSCRSSTQPTMDHVYAAGHEPTLNAIQPHGQVAGNRRVGSGVSLPCADRICVDGISRRHRRATDAMRRIELRRRSECERRSAARSDSGRRRGGWGCRRSITGWRTRLPAEARRPAARRSTRAHAVLERVFGYKSFRSHQQAIVETLIDGGDALVLMPTGGGKSLCYQVPALVRPGTGVVVSPLIALMQDQVDALKQAGVSAQLPQLDAEPRRAGRGRARAARRRARPALRRARAARAGAHAVAAVAAPRSRCSRSTRRTACRSGATTSGPSTASCASSPSASPTCRASR